MLMRRSRESRNLVLLPPYVMVRWQQLFAMLLISLIPIPLWASTGGTVSGSVSDSSGASLVGAQITLLNLARKISYHATSSRDGLYSFPNVAVGRYDLSITADGFSPRQFTNIAVDTGASLRIDAVLTVGPITESTTVNSSSANQVETMDTQLGQTVESAQMEAIPLNGRSFTDLLAIQPGVAPMTTLLPSSVIMAGVTGSIDPSGDANPGNLSINGQRESSNGFMVNGVDVQEHMNGGTSIIPNLDSMDQFRVLTNNFDTEYGNYNGGMVAVASKLGTNRLHGNAFEFFRNTALDSRGYFDPTRSPFNQNQFGGTVGGPIVRDNVFFFTDYQGTRTTEGVSTGNISVPSANERAGIFSQSALTGTVGGGYFAQILSHELGYSVVAGEPYSSVFPNGVIPKTVWSAPATHLLAYIPSANVGANQFSTSANSETVRDDKGSIRIDANLRVGQVSGYYFADDYTLDNPYPGSVAGASIPGFDALYLGHAQLVSLGDTKLIGAKVVNEFHLGYLRNANVIGQPNGGVGVSLATQGFSTGTSGIYVQAPKYEGVENITFPSFVMGVPITNETQVNNTLYVSNGLSLAIRSHTLKVGAQFHLDQINEHPNATFNGTFNINGTETGSASADFLLGIASNFTQSSGPQFYLRDRYFGLYVQDSWRASRSLTINAGIRWDIIAPWSEKYNRLQTWVAGAHSTLYPGAPTGLVVPGDPGIPSTIAPIDHGSFAPRLGLAYSPSFGSGIGKLLFGGSGTTSIRASYGLFYTAFPGLSAGIMYAVPPFGYNYLSPGPPLLTTPFITAATGINNGQRFPFAFPPNNTSSSHPDASINWANFVPLSADPFFDRRNRPPYLSSYMFSIQREVFRNAVLTVSFVGNEGHRELALISANPGNPELCLRLASAGCGPFGEDSTYTTASGGVVNGTRMGQQGGLLVGSGENYGENTADSSIANSNYNALETTLRYVRGASQFLISYTCGKSIDQGSNLGEQLNPTHPRATRAISAWDIKHDLVASYSINIPLAFVHFAPASLIKGWTLSGVTRFATGLPVTLTDNSDRSLLGTLGNGANNYLLDTPQFISGALKINSNGRNGRPEFNTELFSEEALGQTGNAKRRMFYGPGIDNFDLTVQKTIQLPDTKSVVFRVEAFNTFNHAQFYGPSAVDGQIEDPNFGMVIRAASPRLMQLAAKFSF